MRKLLVLILCAMFAIALCGCSSGSCVKIGGTYLGASGEVEYCWNQQKTKDTGVPTFDEKTEDGQESTIFGIAEDEISAIIDKLKGRDDETGAMTLKSDGKVAPIVELKVLLTKWKETRARAKTVTQ